jgi:hypothetical protein
VHATTRPGACRSGRPASPGSRRGTATFKWQPELGRRQDSVAGRETVKGGCPWASFPRLVTRVIAGPDEGLTSHPQTLLGQGPGEGREVTRGSRSTLAAEGPRPGHTSRVSPGDRRVRNQRGCASTRSAPAGRGVTGTWADQPGVSQTPGGCPDPKPQWRSPGRD